MSEIENLKPLGLQKALLLFLIPAILMFINVFFIMGVFNSYGLSIFYNYSIIYGIIPLSFLLLFSIYLYKKEGNPIRLDAFTARFRLKKLSKSDLLWAFGLFLIMLVGTVIFKFTSVLLAEWIKPPSYWPSEINPLTSSSMSSIPVTFMGEKLHGNWLVFLFVLINIILVSFSEEFMWRGYILPRQEGLYGDNAWIVHGLLWTIFHLFTPWNLILLLPGALALSYVAQRLKNTTVVMISHGLVDGLLTLIILFIAIL